MSKPIVVGQQAFKEVIITQDDVDQFAILTGDTNPIHIDTEYAKTSRFGKRIAHGMLVAGHISSVLGTMLPGPGALYLGQQLSFKKPVYPGDNLIVTVAVIDVREDKPIVKLKTICTNQDDEIVVEGEAVLFCPWLGEK